MNYQGTLLAVRDMQRSIRFYCDLLGLSVSADYGENVSLSGGIFLQTIESWSEFIQKTGQEITLPHHASELYFEEADMDAFLRKLESWTDLRYVHPLKEHRWGQRVVRFYDPDGHIIEVGEEMSTVAHRFYDSGMTPEQIAVRMDVTLDHVVQWLKT
jgi:catechol 2,3-dioxygenase-like lactoylglutathione lyase family enzyme